MSYSVKMTIGTPFLETGTGLNSAFQPMVGNPQLEKTYFSWMVNQPPALHASALRATKAKIAGVYGQRLNKAPGARHVVQLDTKKGDYFSSSDKTWLRFQQLVFNDLMKMEPSLQTAWATTGNGMTRPFDTLATNGAIPMNPSLSPRLDKIGKVDAELPSMYMRVLRLVTEIYTERWEPTGVQQNNKSHFGVLCDTFKKDDKIDFVVNRVVNPHGSEFAERLVAVDGDWFVAQYGSYPVVISTARFQLDRIGKERKGYDWTGHPKTADKSVPLEFGLPGFEMTAMRQRVAYAVDGVCNAVVSPVFAGYRACCLSEYGLSWHTSKDEDLTEPIQRYGHFALYDAAQFDTTYTREEIDHITDNLQGATDLCKAYIKRVSHLPIVVKSDERGEAGAFFFNNTTYRAGHQSGVAWVSDYNKIRGSSHWLYGLVLLGHVAIGSDDEMKHAFRAILKHDDEHFALVNQGDDTMALASSAKTLVKWCEIVESLEFAVWERDSGKKMIGKVLYQRTPSSKLEVIPDIVTLVERLLINERSVHSKHRPMSSAGNLIRIGMIESHPGCGSHVMDVLDRHAIAMFGDTLKNLYRQTLYKDESDVGLSPGTLGDLSQYNEETRTYILDQSSIHYKVDKDKIDPLIFKAFNAAIEADDAAWIVRRMKFMKPDFHPALGAQENDNSKRYIITQSERLKHGFIQKH